MRAHAYDSRDDFRDDTCSRRRAFAVWVDRNQDEVPFAENSVARLLGLSFYGDTQERVRKCISDDNLRRNSVFNRAEIVVDVGVGYFRRRDRLRACTPT